ncbi:Aste57867_23271 [Aphanomyces stellatus]|uniref:Aste57867_23271 protein n=1 Tax=Aphanomyces stellatus TaxID=120398 RepID=A0A485LN36_9STRA|nr:hypothetical protein As57867_023200 [Aphanomyces stellatus]VFT99916.1 Aste57867_23271 [Aphanomyces stellatus]
MGWHRRILAASLVTTSAVMATPCHAATLCIMTSGLACNQSVGQCPPCLYLLPTGLACLNKVNHDVGCPIVRNVSLLMDCDNDPTTNQTRPIDPIVLTTIPSSTTAPLRTSSKSTPSSTSLPISTTTASTTTQDVNVPRDLTDVYFALAIGLGLCLLVTLCCLAKRRREQRRLEPPVATDMQVKIFKHAVDANSSNRMRVVSGTSPDVDSNGMSVGVVESASTRRGLVGISVSSSGLSIDEEDDILSTIFMRFRTTNDYAEERYSSFSNLTLSMDSSVDQAIEEEDEPEDVEI